MQSRRPLHSSPGHPPPPPPIPAAHGRSPSVSSASSTSSVRSSSRQPFTTFPNSSSSTIKLAPPTTPRPPSRSSASTAPPPLSGGIHTSPRAAIAQLQQQRPALGYFEPTLMHPSAAAQQQQPSQVAAAYAMQSSMRKRSATEPSPTSPPLTGSVMSSVAGAAANAVFHSVTAAMSIPHPPLPPPPPSERGLASPSTSAPVATKKEGKMKIFSKPGRSGTPGIEKALKPPPSPNKMAQISSPIPRLAPGSAISGAAGRGLDDSRKPSYSSLATGISGTTLAASDSASFMGYSESPPATYIERGFKEAKEESGKKEKDHHSHKPHFLRARRDKDHGMFSSSNSNSKIVPETSGLYSFGPSSPPSTVFPSSKDLQKSISGIDITSASKASKSFKTALGASSYEESFLAPELAPTENAWPILCDRVLPLFAGDPLRNTVEDLNKLVTVHIRRCVERRDPVLLLHDVRKLLEIGMSSIAPHLSDLPDEPLLTRIVEIWGLVFGYTTPYLEAVFLPLQQEFKGSGSILSARESREFFGIDVAATASSPMGLDVRRLIMIAVRDCVVLPVYERLRVLFSRLQMDFSRNQEEGMEVVGRMLQCVSVLAAAGTGDERQGMIDELGKRLKWNWLSRGRTGRNRRGFVGTKMRVGA